MVNIKKIHTYTGHKDAVYTLEKGNKENLFYSSGGDGQVVEWDLNNHENGRLIAKVPASVYALHCIPEKNILIVGQNYEGIHLINLDDLSEIGSLKLSKAAIFDIKTHNNLIFVAAGEGELYIIDLSTLQIVKKSLISENNLRTILITENNKVLIGSSDGQIIQVDPETLNVENEIIGHENSVFSLAQFQGSNFFLTGSRDARLKYWKHDGILLEESINAHMYAINDISFHSSGHNFATASMDKTIKIWDYEKRKLLKVIDKARHQGHLSSVNKIWWSGFHDYLISCSDDRSISVWDIDIQK